MKGMGNMMKQAQQLQSKMMKLQEELAEKTVESSSGGGMVCSRIWFWRRSMTLWQKPRKWSARK